MPIRTKQLWRAVPALLSFQLVYTCPGDRTAIVRRWRFVNWGTSALLLDVALDNPAVSNELAIYQHSLPAKSYLSEEPYAVLEPAQTVWVRTSIATLSHFGWGVELAGVAP